VRDKALGANDKGDDRIMHVRRVVTGLSASGRSTVISDGAVPRAHDFASIPGFSNVTVWATQPGETRVAQPKDLTETLTSLLPDPGGSTFFIVRFPPDSAIASVDFEAAGEEQARELPGLVDTFDPERPGFHATPSIDYVILLEGELWLELEEGDPVQLRQGDVLVQNGTWHAWHNRTENAVVIAAISLGAKA
jgi:quercetin dioxygenase-like cupin family protein